MIKNTDLLYKNIQKFHDERKEILAKHEKAVNNLKAYEGSKGYEEEMKAVDEARDEALSELRGVYAPKFKVIINGMREQIGKRSVKAPTNEQVNILNMLKLKKKPTQEECDRVAQSVSDNPMALSIVTEIAREAGYMGVNYASLCPEISSQDALEGVDSIQKNLADFMTTDASRASRIASLYNEDHHGTPTPLRRVDFNTREEAYRTVCGFNEDYLGKFSALVDGGAEDGGQEVS